MTNYYQYIQVIIHFGGGGDFELSISNMQLTCSFFILLVLPVLGRGVLIRDRVSDIEISLISKNTILIFKKTTHYSGCLSSDKHERNAQTS